MWTITRLDADSASGYDELTYPRYRDRKKLTTDILAFGASIQGQPAGLVLASLPSGRKEGILLSLMVTNSNRNKGIGSALLARLEAELESLEANKVFVKYTTIAAGIPAFEHVLAKQGWSDPKLSLHFYRADAKRWSEASWIAGARLPEGFELFSWGDVTDTERLALQNASEESDWRKKGLNPFNNEKCSSPHTSLGLRHRGELAGWLITHRVSYDVLRYSTLYVLPRFQRMARGIPLMAEVLRRQVEMGVPYLDWLVSPKNPEMMEFVRRRMTPYLISESESRHSHKQLATT